MTASRTQMIVCEYFIIKYVKYVCMYVCIHVDTISYVCMYMSPVGKKRRNESKLHFLRYSTGGSGMISGSFSC